MLSPRMRNDGQVGIKAEGVDLDCGMCEKALDGSTNRTKRMDIDAVEAIEREVETMRWLRLSQTELWRKPNREEREGDYAKVCWERVRRFCMAPELGSVRNQK